MRHGFVKLLARSAQQCRNMHGELLMMSRIIQESPCIDVQYDTIQEKYPDIHEAYMKAKEADKAVYDLMVMLHGILKKEKEKNEH